MLHHEVMSLRNGRSDEGAAHFQAATQQLSSPLPSQLLFIIPGNHSLLFEQSRNQRHDSRALLTWWFWTTFAFDSRWVCPEISSSSPHFSKPRKTKVFQREVLLSGLLLNYGKLSILFFSSIGLEKVIENTKC